MYLQKGEKLKVKSRVMLVDDHALFMEGLKYLLDMHGINVVCTVNSGSEAMEKACLLKPDMILMDIRMPGCSGLDALRMIKAEMPEIKVIMLTTSEEDEDLFDAVRYGASGYLLKNTNAEELIGMLQDVEKNEAPPLPGFASRLLTELKKGSEANYRFLVEPSEDAGKGVLSNRHLEILEMVAKGVTYKEAGEALGLTERTVKYHMNRIIELLHLENRAQVIAYAARMGFGVRHDT